MRNLSHEHAVSPSMLFSAIIVAGLFAASSAHAQRTEQGFSSCVRIDNTSNQLAAFLENHCNIKLVVYYTDESSHWSNWGASDLGPGSKDSIPHVKGYVRVAACRWPIVPKINPNGYECIPLG